MKTIFIIAIIIGIIIGYACLMDYLRVKKPRFFYMLDSHPIIEKLLIAATLLPAGIAILIFCTKYKANIDLLRNSPEIVIALCAYIFSSVFALYKFPEGICELSVLKRIGGFLSLAAVGLFVYLFFFKLKMFDLLLASMGKENSIWTFLMAIGAIAGPYGFVIFAFYLFGGECGLSIYEVIFFFISLAVAPALGLIVGRFVIIVAVVIIVVILVFTKAVVDPRIDHGGYLTKVGDNTYKADDGTVFHYKK